MTTTSRNPIVVGVSPTDSANDVVAWGAREAMLRQRPLLLVHAYDAPGALTTDGRAASGAARQAYRQAAGWVDTQRAHARRLWPDGDIEATARDGSWVEVLLQQASGADMLVVGSGDGWRNDGLAAARDVQLVTHAEIPVIVVRGGGRVGGTTAGRIVVGCGENDPQEVLLAAAFDEADRRGVSLRVVSAPGNAAGSIHQSGVGDALVGWCQKYPHVGAEYHRSVEPPAAALVEASAAADLVVVGNRGSGGFPGLRLGSVTDAVLRHAGCPVLVVPVGSR